MPRTLLRQIITLFLGIFALLLITAVYNAHILINTTLYEEYKSKAEALSKNLENTLEIAHTTHNIINIQEEVDEFKGVKDVEYVIIKDSQKKVVAHTFNAGLPQKTPRFDILEIVTPVFEG